MCKRGLNFQFFLWPLIISGMVSDLTLWTSVSSFFKCWGRRMVYKICALSRSNILEFNKNGSLFFLVKGFASPPAVLPFPYLAVKYRELISSQACRGTKKNQGWKVTVCFSCIKFNLFYLILPCPQPNFTWSIAYWVQALYSLRCSDISQHSVN